MVAVGTNRFTEARLSDDFSWGPRPATLRSGLQSSLPASLLVATSRIQMLTEGQDDGWMLRARGISALAAGDVSMAIQALEQAVTADPQEARLRNDLAAALLERYRLRGDVADANAALARVTEALRMEAQLAPALFNRALALEAISGSQCEPAGVDGLPCRGFDVAMGGRGQGPREVNDRGDNYDAIPRQAVHGDARVACCLSGRVFVGATRQPEVRAVSGPGWRLRVRHQSAPTNSLVIGAFETRDDGPHRET